MNTLKTATLAFLALGSAAYGQDSTEWTGGYVGLSLSSVNAQSTVTGVGAFFLVAPDGFASNYDTAPKGTPIGARVGYDVSLGSGWLMGVEGAINPGAVSDTIADPAGELRDTITTKLDQNMELKARLGYVTGQTLLYGTAGIASARSTILLDDAVAPNETDTLKGMLIGAGVEHKLSDKLSISLEYIHTDYDTQSIYADTRYALDADVVSDSVRIGMNYRF